MSFAIPPPRTRQWRQLLLLLLLPLILLVSQPVRAATEELPALNIDINESSISGLSSGAFMAVQFQVAHSRLIKGAGIVAGGPYYCSQGNALRATMQCSCTLDPTHALCTVTTGSADIPDLVADTRRFATQGLIDPIDHLPRQRLLIIAGGKDQTVPATVSANQLADYYQRLGIPAANVSLVRLAQAGHTMPTLTYGQDCGLSASPYLGKCQYDAAKAILGWIYGPLHEAAIAKSDKNGGRLLQFDQRPFLGKGSNAAASGLDSTGWAYIPASCQKGEACRVHVALHGCKQGQSYLPLTPVSPGNLYYGTTFIDNAGYNRWADNNHLVILYPQAASVPGKNPNGCWDWWGYTDENFANRKGVQITAIRAMLDRLAAGKR